MNPTTYRIKDWDSHFEVAQTRAKPGVKHSWVATPNKHDGKGFARVRMQANADLLFSRWNLIIQIASKCPRRGVLVDDGKALTAEDLALATGFSEEGFEVALAFFSSEKVGWLEKVSADLTTPPAVAETVLESTPLPTPANGVPSPSSDPPDTQTPPDQHSIDTALIPQCHPVIAPVSYITVPDLTNRTGQTAPEPARAGVGSAEVRSEAQALQARVNALINQDPRIDHAAISSQDRNALFTIARDGGWPAVLWCLDEGVKKGPRRLGTYVRKIFDDNRADMPWNKPAATAGPKRNGHVNGNSYKPSLRNQVFQ
jgi:hypothetical protein